MEKAKASGVKCRGFLHIPACYQPVSEGVTLQGSPGSKLGYDGQTPHRMAGQLADGLLGYLTRSPFMSSFHFPCRIGYVASSL
jgi:hypothetical protein